MVARCKPLTKDHLPLTTTFPGTKGWSLVTGFTVCCFVSHPGLYQLNGGMSGLMNTETVFFSPPDGVPVPGYPGFVFNLPCTIQLTLQQSAISCTNAPLQHLPPFSLSGSPCNATVLTAGVTNKLFQANRITLAGGSEPIDVIQLLNVTSLAMENTLTLLNASSSCSKSELTCL